jgi:hypothetical protein
MSPNMPPTGRRAYTDLRVLLEALLDADDDAAQAQAMAAMRVWLRTHCATCGTIVERAVRRPDKLSPTCWQCDVGNLA